MALYPLKHTFTEGDTDALARYTLKRNGSALDLTGYTEVKLYVRPRSGSAVAAITGSIVSPSTSGVVEFDHTTIAAAAGSYLCQIRTTNSGGDFRRTPYFQTDVLEPVEG